MAAALGGEDAEGLAGAGTVEEGVFLCVAQRLAELLQQVVLQTEGIVIQQLFGDLHANMELVGIQNDLIEGGITEGQFAAFLDPCCSGLGACDVDLMRTQLYTAVICMADRSVTVLPEVVPPMKKA